jgi:hypothetical protein
MQENDKLKNILNNHGKLLSMINDKSLPIKNLLLKDVKDMAKILEIASSRKENKT